MSDTQGYKVANEFTVPAVAIDIVLPLFQRRQRTVQSILDHPDVMRDYSKNEVVQMAFESLMLAKMIGQMTGAENA